MRKWLLAFVICWPSIVLADVSDAVIVSDAASDVVVSDVVAVAEVHDAGTVSDVQLVVTAAVSEEVLAKLPVQTIEPRSIGDVFDLGKAIFEAAKNGQWTIFVGLIIMAIVWTWLFVIRTFLPGFLTSDKGKKAIPWISIALSTLLGVGISLATPGMQWYHAISFGFASGLAAIGGWEALFKHLLPKGGK